MAASRARARQRVLCAGIVVLDEVFRVAAVPAIDSKVESGEFVTVGGGCAANAAVAVARLGGRVRFAGPLGRDEVARRILVNLKREKVGVADCVQVAGASSSVSAIFVDAQGRRTIVTYSDPRLLSVTPRHATRMVAQADGILVDNRRPKFVTPLCRAACARNIPVVLDADKPARPDDALLKLATHVIFSSESLRATTGIDDLAAGLAKIHRLLNRFVAVTDGANDILWIDGGSVHALPAFRLKAVDTLAAGDVFHGAFTFALLEGRELQAALRFAAAAAAVKCMHFGGSATAPTRAAVEAFLRRT